MKTRALTSATKEHLKRVDYDYEYEYEYEQAGTACFFMFVKPLADKHVEKMEVNLIVKIHKLPMSLTIKEFWYRVAILRGFLRRKSDGNPGWQTIRYGWIRLQDMFRGAALAGWSQKYEIFT
ncbi:MAG: hypothetical protein WCG14_08135 [Chlamydiia bacterium]